MGTTSNKQMKKKKNHFNDSFFSYNNIDTSNTFLPEMHESNMEGLTAIHVIENKIYDILKCLDTNKATGPDGISPKVLKEAGVSIVPSLSRLIKMSLNLSKTPTLWKRAHVLPLFKKGIKADVNNYRPVSILCCASKILEKIIFKNVYNYFRDNNLLTPHQSGFQPGDSTVHQLSYLYHKFCEALDQKKEIRLVFCDISKAFDRVWHEGIIFKLRKLGIKGPLLTWFEDYLGNGYQTVIVRGQNSKWGLLKAGVPQGSVLGPLLFLVYINDIVEGLNCEIKLFADDTTIYITYNNHKIAENLLNENLAKINDWAQQWLVSFSPNKTKAMSLSFKAAQSGPITFNNVVLEEVKEHKHLGLTLASNLNWSTHIDNIISETSRMSDILNMI